jgi:hypothetical protein
VLIRGSGSVASGSASAAGALRPRERDVFRGGTESG